MLEWQRTKCSFEDKKCSKCSWWEQHALNKHKSFRHLFKFQMLNLSDLKLGWSNTRKRYRSLPPPPQNPASRVYILILQQTAVDDKSLNDWSKSEFISILGWIVPNLCSSNPASSLTTIETSVSTVLAFPLAGRMACTENLRSRDPDILVQLDESIWILTVTELWWARL